jgi:hypothetical protein
MTKPANMLLSRAVAPLVFAMMIALLWQPFGLTRLGLYEEWAMFNYRDSGLALAFIVPDSGPDLEKLLTRPTSLTPYALALALTPDSFVGFHLVLIAVLFGIGLFGYFVLCRLLADRRALAWAISALFLLFPADTALLAFRNMTTPVTAMMLWLLAVWLLLVYQDTRRVWLLIPIWGCLAASVWMYEAGIALILATPILCLWRSRKLSWFLLWLIVAWVAVPVALNLYTLWFLQTTASSQRSAQLLASINWSTLGQTLLSGAQRLFTRMFAQAWGDAAQEVQSFRQYLPNALLIAGVACGAFIALAWRGTQATPQRFGKLRWLSLFVIGLICTWLGFAIFSLSPDYSLLNNRTFILPAFGAAIVIGLLLYAVSRLLLRKWYPVLFVVPLFALCTLCAIHLLAQHHTYNELSDIQKRVLGQMTEIAPVLKPGTFVVLVDESGLLRDEHFWGYEGDLTDPAALYPQMRVVGTVCHAAPSYGNNVGQCIFEKKELYISGGNDISGFGKYYYDYYDMVAFRFTAARTLELIRNEALKDYRPERRIDSSQRNLRADAMFMCSTTVETCTPSVTFAPVERFFTDFDLHREYLRIGHGWRGTEFLNGVTFSWMDAPAATANLLLSTQHDGYTVQARILLAALPEQIPGLKLTVNGVNIPLTLSEDAQRAAIATGRIPRAAVERNGKLTQLVWTVPRLHDVPNTSIKIGVAFDWLRIEPETNP